MKKLILFLSLISFFVSCKKEPLKPGMYSAPEPPKPVDIAPERNAAEGTAASRRARQRRSSLISSVATPDALGADASLGTGEKI